MQFFRDADVRKHFVIHILITVAFVLLAFIFHGQEALLIMTFSIVLGLVFVFFLHRRAKKVKELSEDLERMLHAISIIPLTDYQEGELSILFVQLEKLLRRFYEQSERLKHSQRYLSDALADISHQIRTPLTSLNLLITRLRNPNIDEEKRTQMMQEISLLLNRLENLVEALLKMAKLDSDVIHFENNTYPLQKLLDDSLNSLGIRFELKDVRLKITCKGEFQGDLLWTVEALTNILKNCLEHSPEGSTMEITAEENTLYSEVIIRDQGPGFQKQDLEHLFERFYKGENSSLESVGIGLALAQMIISRQNGVLKANNRPWGGAEFKLRLYKSVV